MNHGGCAIYKCRMCGKTHWNLHVPDMGTTAVCVITDTPLPATWGGHSIKMVDRHLCKEKNGVAICWGISDLIGFEEKER